MAKLFLSYRRSDAADAAGRLHDYLAQHFGPQAIFLDVDSIPVGVNFRSHLQQAVIRCNVLLAVIGERWLNVAYDDGPRQGQRRIDDPDDYMRIEIEAALASGIPVVPVLVGGAKMPTAADLPPGMKALAFQQAAEARAGRDFHSQVQRLLNELMRLLGVDRAKDSAADAALKVVPLPERPAPEATAVTPAPAAPDVAARIAAALCEIDADEHADMGSYYVLDKNSRRVFGRVDTELARTPPAEVRSALLPHLDSVQPMVRWKALRLLLWWKLATPDIVRRFWEKETSWVCRQLVIEAAQGLAEGDRLDLLADVALRDDNGRNRAAALPHLAALARGPQRGRVIDVLLELLDMADRWGASGARPEALKQLRVLKVPEAVEKVCQLLRQDAEYTVRNEAAGLIAEQGPVASLVDIGEAFATDRINDYVFKKCLASYLKRFSQPAVTAAVAAIEAEKARQLAEAVLREHSAAEAGGVTMSPYYRPFTGKLIYQNGSEQTFSGFRCFYSGRLYYAQDVESLGTSNYTTAASIDLKQLERVDFTDRPDANVRRGTARFRNGTVLQDVFFYVSECSWWETPGLEGKMNNPSICALVIIEYRQKA